MPDIEPQPTEENNPHVPFLTENQLRQLGHSFNLDNFNVISPPDQEPFMVVTIPESVSRLVDLALQKAKEEAFKRIKEVGTGLQDAPESERGVWSEMYWPTLQGVGSFYLVLTLVPILLSAESGALINALTVYSKMADPQEKQLVYREIERKEKTMDNFLSKGGRYMVYNGDKLVFKSQADLENPYYPSSAGRQN